MQYFIWLFLIFAAFIIFSIIRAVAKSDGERGNTDTKKEERIESHVSEFRLTNERRDYVAVKPVQKSFAATKAANGTRMVSPSKQKSKLAPNVSLSTNIKSRTESHTHPLEDGAEYRIERVDMGGSLGGEFTEGCADQYFQRLVKLDKEEIERSEPNYDLIKTVVFGEMLAKPKFKK